MFKPLHIVIVDHPDSGSDGANLLAFSRSIQKGLEDFAVQYLITGTVGIAQPDAVQPGDFPIGLFGDPDEPGALGYHQQGFGKVFPKLDKADGAELSQTIDHEIKEALADLTCDKGRMGADGHFWADEPSDAVEQDSIELDGVKLSNFVWPSWYSGDGDKYDQLGLLKAPLTVTPGGYAQWFSGTGWHQITHAEREPRSYRKLELGRSARRRVKFATSRRA